MKVGKEALDYENQLNATLGFLLKHLSGERLFVNSHLEM
jgi:hypothetical protein